MHGHFLPFKKSKASEIWLLPTSNYIPYSGFKITSSLKNEQLCMHLYQKENLKTMFIMEDWLLPLLQLPSTRGRHFSLTCGDLSHQQLTTFTISS